MEITKVRNLKESSGRLGGRISAGKTGETTSPLSLRAVDDAYMEERLQNRTR
jgi:hypothetical protein